MTAIEKSPVWWEKEEIGNHSVTDKWHPRSQLYSLEFTLKKKRLWKDMNIINFMNFGINKSVLSRLMMH